MVKQKCQPGNFPETRTKMKAKGEIFSTTSQQTVRTIQKSDYVPVSGYSMSTDLSFSIVKNGLIVVYSVQE
jgi:hypothetical protein